MNMVMVDINETVTAPQIWDAFECPKFKSNLEGGDYIVECEDGTIIAIERKTPSDLMASIADGRLFNQVVEMKKVTKWVYVVITGQLEPTFTGVNDTQWDFRSVWGALETVQELGAVVTFCDGTGNFVPTVKTLAKRSRDEVKIMPRRGAYVFGGQEATLASLPNIGGKKAIEYNAAFDGNLALALSVLTAPHDGKKNHLKGWGKKSRDGLVGFLGGRIEYFTGDE